jgi:DNA-binding transcriptional MocR family regulator
MGTLHRRIAEHYVSLFKLGILAVGQRMPSLRELMRAHTVSLSTAIQVCRNLEEQGWVEARPRLGFFVLEKARLALRPNLAEPSEVVVQVPQESGARVATLRSVGATSRKTIIDLAAATCAPELYPTSELQKICVRTLRRFPNILTSMANRDGNPELKAALAKRALARGIQVTPTDIVITNGCSESLMLALRAVSQPGDVVAVESPAYYGFLDALDALGLKALEVPTSRDSGLIVEALEFALKGGDHVAAVVCVPTVHNPMGCTMQNTEKERLVRLCEERGIALIEDDVYGELAPDPLSMHAVKSWDRSGQVIYCNSLNKTLSPGLRLGWMLPGKWQAKIRAITATLSRPKDELPQMVVAEFLSSGGYDRHLRRLRARLDIQRSQTADCLMSSFGSDARFEVPEAGTLLWVELPDVTSSMRLYDAAGAAGIHIAPGAMFSRSGRFDSFLRFGCGWPLTAEREGAIKKLVQIVRRMQVTPKLLS